MSVTLPFGAPTAGVTVTVCVVVSEMITEAELAKESAPTGNTEMAIVA